MTAAGEASLDAVFLNTQLNSIWIAPILTIGNLTYNLSSLLLASNVFWTLSDPYQRRNHTALHVVDNR